MGIWRLGLQETGRGGRGYEDRRMWGKGYRGNGDGERKK